MPAIEEAAAPDGTLTYLIHDTPAALPPVLGRDLLHAWDQARTAALHHAPAAPRAFRFARADGTTTDLSLCDPDARCWAGAVDRLCGIASPYGMSVCLRLLALIDLMAAHAWARPLFTVYRNRVDLHPSLLSLAAHACLTEDGRFDAPAFRAQLRM
jgi:hypothetical protein